MIALRTARVLLACWRADLAAAGEYRGELVSGTVVSTAWLLISAAPVLVLSLHVPSAAGWTVPRLLMLLAVFYLLDAVVWTFLALNLGTLSDQVRDGSLDALLLRPVSSLVMCSLSRLHAQDLPKFVLAAGVAVWAVVLGGGPPGPVEAVAALVATGCAVVLIWVLGVLAGFKVLTQVEFDGWVVLFLSQNLARVPVPLYGPVLRVVLTAVIPIAFLTTVPTQLFYGDAAPWVAGVSVLLATGGVLLVSRLWRGELLRYTGAMG